MEHMAANLNAPAQTGLKLSSLIGEKDILVGRHGLSCEEVIRALVSQLATEERLPDAAEWTQAVLEREAVCDTVVGNGVAIPHARRTTIDRPYIALMTSPDGLAFAADKPPVHLVLLVLVPVSQPTLYLQILKGVSQALRDDETVEAVSRLRSAEEVLRFFDRGGFMLPSYLCAADIMIRNLETLKENDSLKTAIDRFIALNIPEMPVVDRYGDMTGVVAAKNLLHICLPDYLLWTYDLSPMVNFEPFTEVLRNEQNSSISDITVGDYARVQIGAPAISVASEMVRRRSDTCYVLQNKKLVGAITLPYFLNKLFRE